MGSIFPEELGGAGWATSSTPSSSRNSRAWMARSASSWRRTLRSARTTFIKPGSEEQKRVHSQTGVRRVDRLLALTEPEAGSDAGGTRMTRRAQGRHGWVLNGAKTFTTNAHYADVCVAMAVTDRAAHSTAFRPSSSKRAPRDFAPARRKTSSACAPAPPAK